jgi:hypothetical protein
MSMSSVDVADQYAALYQATLEQAAQAGESIIGTVLASARLSLKDRVTQSRGFVERDHLELTLKLLDSNARALCERYPQALRTAFNQALQAGNEGRGEGAVALQNVRFDQLELMDSAQVHESVALARSQQSVMLAADAALTELNTYICATLGMKTVQAERNPLRPDVFVRALQSVLAAMQVPTAVQMDWLQHMSAALGEALSVLYKSLSRQLHDEGVTAAGFAVIRTHEGANRALASRGESVPDHDEAVLTLDRLRRLLVGELDQPPAGAQPESFAAQFSREFESAVQPLPAVDFEATVPAAFEALQEMKQVDRLMDRIGTRRQGDGGDQADGDGVRREVREQLRRGASGLGQVLSLEVVALMVENIARDVRLLEPIRDVVKNLEPALLRLALVDPRFFSDKQHPARRLLQEITHRSLAYDAVDTRGFTGFLEPLRRAVSPLADMQIQGSEPFEAVLQELVDAWDEQKQPLQLEKAVQALQHAEERNLLAEKIAREIQARPDAEKVPAAFLEFMCGPWAQVVAHARMADLSGSADPGQYHELVVALFWSAQPALTRKNIAELTRLVPKLLGKLREGLDLIDYPSVKTSAFFDLLMKLHQQAFRPQSITTGPAQSDGFSSSLPDSTNPWIAPAEARISGFMEVQEEVPPLPSPSSTQAGSSVRDAAASMRAMGKTAMTPSEPSLPVGSWVELLVNGAWIRTQLSWASPHGTLFLFTSAYGSTQSMTLRSRDKLLAAGTMRVVSDQAVIDGALDAVVKTAMLNSMDVTR